MNVTGFNDESTSTFTNNTVAFIKFDDGITVPLYEREVEPELLVPNEIEAPKLTYNFFLYENTKDIRRKIDTIKQNIKDPSKINVLVVLENWYEGQADKWSIEFLLNFRYENDKKRLGEEFCRLLTKDELNEALEGYEKLLKYMEKKCEIYWRRFKKNIKIRTL